MKVLSIGIIGFGRIGAEHAGWLEKCPRLRVVAAADPTPARAEMARQRGLRACDSVDQLLGDAAIDAVLVSTPTAMHLQQAAAALRAGKHVMVEKPMAMNLAEAKELVELGRRQRRVLSVFHNRRWDLDYLTVRSAIDAALLGKLINVESRLGQWASCVGPAAREYRPNWRNEAAFGGGGLLDWGSHFLDQLWQLMLPARAARVFAELRGNVWSGDCDDFARVCIDFDNGAVGMVEINTTTTRPLPRWHIDAVGGTLEGPSSGEFDVRQWSRLEFAPAGGGPARPVPLASPGLSETQIWDCFAGAVLDGTPPAVTGQSALPTMALLDAARQSSQSGRAIELDEDFWKLFD